MSLNFVFLQQLPFTEQRVKYCLSWSCKRNPIYISATLAATAFIPGDIVKYSITIENRTRCFDVKRISAFIIQIFQYKSLKPKLQIKTEMKTINYTAHLNPCPRNTKNVIDNVFELPNNLVSTSGNKSILMVGYRFQVLMVIKGLHWDCSLIIPITIGSHRETCNSEGIVKGYDSGDCESTKLISNSKHGSSLQFGNFGIIFITEYFISYWIYFISFCF